MKALNVVSIAVNNSKPQVSLDTLVASGYASIPIYGFGTGVTNRVTATGYGGQEPYTYLWTITSGSSGIICVTPTSNNTIWTANSSETAFLVETWHCTVTDNLGHTAVSEDVTVSIQFEQSP